jgi:hypothetical protein
MAESSFVIGDRVKVKGRPEHLYVLVDVDSSRGKARVCPLISSPFGLTNGDPEWIDYSRLQKVEKVYAHISFFQSYTSLKNTYDNLEENCSDYCKGFLDATDRDMSNAIRNKSTSYFPIPDSAPESLEEAKKKTSFNEVEMEFYRKFKKEFIDDFIHELKFKTLAEVEADKFMYNDRQLGEFDFAKASAGLNKRFEYYSVKHKKVVPFDEVEITGTERNYKYKLKLDGSDVVIREELGFNGKPKFYSTVKKSYLMKEKVKREKNAVRIFLYQGGSGSVSGNGILYPAMTAVALTEILETIGYSVSFISGWDASQHLTKSSAGTAEEKVIYIPELVKNGIYNPRKGGWTEGERYVMFNVKSFEQNLNIPELLYVTASPSLYLWRAWKNMFLTFDKHKDKYVDIGYLGYFDNWREAIYSAFMPRDVNKGVIYVTIRNIHSVEDVKERVREVVKYAEAYNRNKREELGLL